SAPGARLSFRSWRSSFFFGAFFWSSSISAGLLGAQALLFKQSQPICSRRSASFVSQGGPFCAQTFLSSSRRPIALSTSPPCSASSAMASSSRALSRFSFSPFVFPLPASATPVPRDRTRSTATAALRGIREEASSVPTRPHLRRAQRLVVERRSLLERLE